MPESCIFLGNYKPVIKNFDWKSAAGIPVMAQNYFYRPYGDIEELKHPEEIYQIHWRFNGESPDGDTGTEWIDEYNKTGSKIITVSDYEGLNNYEVLDVIDYMKRFGLFFFSSTTAFMFAREITLKRYDKIYMLGFYMVLNENEISVEYKEQVPGVLDAIDLARKNGIEVICPMEKVWRKLSKVITVAWANIDDGTTIVPYWIRKYFGGRKEVPKIEVEEFLKKFYNENKK